MKAGAIYYMNPYINSNIISNQLEGIMKYPLLQDSQQGGILNIHIHYNSRLNEELASQIGLAHLRAFLELFGSSRQGDPTCLQNISFVGNR